MNRSHAGPATRTAPPDLARLIEHYENWRAESDYPDPEMADEPLWPALSRKERDAARARLVAAIQAAGLGYADHAGFRYRVDGDDLFRAKLSPRSGPKGGKS